MQCLQGWKKMLISQEARQFSYNLLCVFIRDVSFPAFTGIPALITSKLLHF